MSQILPPLPAQSPGTPWPTKSWPTGPLPAHANKAALDKLIGDAFEGGSDQLGETHALVIIHAGKLVMEHYAEGFGPTSTFPSWSKAKSITQALVGILVGDGKLDIHAPAAVPGMGTCKGDPRTEINIDQLLRMSSGLKFVEDYEPGHPSDVIEMLFGSGKADVAHYAASQPLIHPPGTHWSYASGTTNIVARCAANAVGASGPAFETFMRERLFGPLGMTTPPAQVRRGRNLHRLLLLLRLGPGFRPLRPPLPA